MTEPVVPAPLRRRVHDYDVLVVGAGLAGLVAAARAAAGGARVGVVARSTGNTSLWSGLVSANGRQPRRTPADDFFVHECRRAGIPYEECPGPLLSPSGQLRAARLAPVWWRSAAVDFWVGARGASDTAPRLLVVGFTELGDYPAPFIAAQAEQALGVRIAQRSMSLGRAAGRGLESRLAYLFDDRTWFTSFLDMAGKVLAADASPAAAIAFPPVLGLFEVERNLSELTLRLGKPAFELPGMPPSVPGLRFWRRWRHALEADGRVTFHLGLSLNGSAVEGGVCRALLAGAREFRARVFVLATGGVAGGGLEVRATDFFSLAGSSRPEAAGLHEPILGLDSAGDGLHWNTWGLLTDAQGRPERAGQRLENVLVAGWARSGCERTAHGSIQTGYQAGEAAGRLAQSTRAMEASGA